MNPETLLVDAWLNAGIQSSIELVCPGEATLTALVSRQMPEQEARRLTLHLTSCASCRRAVAGLVALHAAPTTGAVALADLLARHEVTEAWRSWVHGLVSCLPADADDVGGMPLSGYEEIAPSHIDAQGRLIVDLMPGQAPRTGDRVRLGLSSEGTRLDLCEVTIRSGRLRAVVDLSAFHPRPGVLRPGVLEAEDVPVPAAIPALLPILAELQDGTVTGAPFWDRLTSSVEAFGNQLDTLLAHEIEIAESDQTTRAPHSRAGAMSAAGELTDKTPIGRVQYTLHALEEYASLWKECNGKELDGAVVVASHLRAALSPPSAPALQQNIISEPALSAVEQAARIVEVPRSRRETL